MWESCGAQRALQVLSSRCRSIACSAACLPATAPAASRWRSSAASCAMALLRMMPLAWVQEGTDHTSVEEGVGRMHSTLWWFNAILDWGAHDA
jgi:hypothetical protein